MKQSSFSEKISILPGIRSGTVRIPASKSQAHRLLICAALGEETCEIVCDGISADIAATAKCLNALGAKVERTETGFLVSPIQKVPEGCCELLCGESGSTLRFLLPVVGALGAQAAFHREGRLPQRPLAPLDGVLTGKPVDTAPDRDELLAIFNRGGFTRGYGPGLIDRELMSRERPNHQGVPVGRPSLSTGRM